MMPPTRCFTHNCLECVYLGYMVIRCRGYDLYYCPLRGDDDPSLLARHGNDGGQYYSAPVSVVASYPEHSDIGYILREAKRLYERKMMRPKIGEPFYPREDKRPTVTDTSPPPQERQYTVTLPGLTAKQVRVLRHLGTFIDYDMVAKLTGTSREVAFEVCKVLANIPTGGLR
jgi:hypothetical protein